MSSVVEKLEAAGFEAYIVGGCVRDALLLKTPYDYDVTTSAVPHEVKTALDGYKIIETGIKHGTVTVWSEGNPIEITTYRCDGEYTDHRRPDSVKLTDKPEAPKYYPRDEVKVLMTAKQRKAENAARNGAPKADDEEVSDEAEDITLTTEVTVTANPVQSAEGDAPRQHPKKHFKKHRKKPPQAE